MSDPIDRLRSTNPVDPDDAPAAPMALADRIMGGRDVPSRAPGWLVATAFATAVLAVGAVWLLWLGDGDEARVAVDTTAVTTTAPAPSTSVVPTTTAPTTATGQPSTTPPADEAVVADLRSLVDIIGEIESLDAGYASGGSTASETADLLRSQVLPDVRDLQASTGALGHATALALLVETAANGLDAGDVAAYDDAVAGIRDLTSTVVTAAGFLGVDLTVVEPERTPAVVYFLLDTGDAAPTLVPVQRLVEVPGDAVELALDALLAGPTAEERESEPALVTALPDGLVITEVIPQERTWLVSVDGVTDEELGAEARAQIAATVLRADPGAPKVLIKVGRRLDIDVDYDDAYVEAFLPAIMIETPADDGVAANPMYLAGTANVFEATVNYAVTDWDGDVVAQGSTLATCGTGCRGDFAVEIHYEVGVQQPGSVRVWEASARDGSPVNVREHTVVLTPGTDAVEAGLSSRPNSYTVPEGDIIVDLEWPAFSWDARPNVVAAMNETIEAYVASLNPSYLQPDGPLEGQPGEYGLAYEVLHVDDGLLSLRFDEYFGVRDAAHPSSGVTQMVFDLTTGARISLADLLTETGVENYLAIVENRVDDLVGGEICCFDPSVYGDDFAVLPGGLLTVIDEADGLPHALGTLEIPVPWQRIASTVDPDGPLGDLDPSAGCSTAGERYELLPQDGLPDPVADIRAAIARIAVTCDFETLAELASDRGFTYSFGGGSDPARFFADQELRGTPLMRYLVQTLNASFDVVEDPDGPDLYLWPSAAAVEWSETTEQQRAEVAAIYGDEALETHAEFGGFVGWRVGITENGEWQLFVAGD